VCGCVLNLKNVGICPFGAIAIVKLRMFGMSLINSFVCSLLEFPGTVQFSSSAIVAFGSSLISSGLFLQ